MAFEVTEAGRLLSRRAMGRSERAVLALGAMALALGAAAWITEPGRAIPFATAALSGPRDQAQEQSSFHERFLGVPSGAAGAASPGLQPLNRSALSAIEAKLWDAKALLAQQLMYGNWRSAAIDYIRPSVDEPRPQLQLQPPSQAAASGIPMPRPRPVVASADPQAVPVVTQADSSPRPDDRTLLQKLSDLMPSKVRLASLTTDGGLFRQGPNLAALGYQPQTAVYDIAAHAVYLPNGMVLEAHSGMGSLRDDPEHVDRRMVGATPPATYDLKPRETLFHGVAALRMTPADGATIFGRAGLLAHPYMLGPLGDSNGCVSIRDYERFLKAYSDGEIIRLVVVPSLSGATATSQRASSQSSSS
jgi:Protein of unknown function (DUF2778)